MKRRYKAVAFDVDGTLTEFCKFQIPKYLQETLNDLPKDLPLALCTGRPLTFIHRKLDAICDHAGDPQAERQRWFVMAENGGAGYFYKNGDYLPFFQRTWPDCISQDALEALIKDAFGWHVTVLIREHTLILIYPKWMYLFPRMVRLESARTAKKLRRHMVKWGFDKDFSIVDSGLGALVAPMDVSKGQAITSWAKHLGIQPEEILCIGDRPDPGGNDEDFLNGHNSATAFTVGLRTKNTWPLPVLDFKKRLLKGPRATNHLLKDLFFNMEEPGA